MLDAEDEVKTTEPPAQNVVVLPAVIVGVGAVALTVTVKGNDVNVGHAPTVFETVYVPPAETTIDGVVAPVDQRILLVTEDVNVTDPPEQKVVDPLAVITGV